MPASGLLPPLRMLVAVRAIAPVAAKPPNIGAAMLAMPWPISSWFESCLVPAMPSATTADSSDSIAPSMAMAKAGPISSSACASVMLGSVKLGNPSGMPPNALPMVVTPLNWKIDWMTVAATIPTSGPGTRCRPRMRLEKITSSRLASASAVVAMCRCGRACSRCQNFWWKWSPVTAGRPKKSFHWPTQMMTPMPAVKPTITGSGMNLMTTPSRATPSKARMTPAIRVAICRPSTPYLAVMPARITMKAPVGPAICTRLPPNTETSRPAMIAV